MCALKDQSGAARREDEAKRNGGVRNGEYTARVMAGVRVMMRDLAARRVYWMCYVRELSGGERTEQSGARRREIEPDGYCF